MPSEDDLPHYRSIQEINLGLPIEQKVKNLEVQVDIHSSRLESEQGTRSRAHKLLHERLDKQDLAGVTEAVSRIMGH